jgi:hypothetical protein
MPTKQKPVSYLNRMVMRILYIIVVIAVTGAIMNFLQVDSSAYLPYLYFFVAMCILSSFLHAKEGELILDA